MGKQKIDTQTSQREEERRRRDLPFAAEFVNRERCNGNNQRGANGEHDHVSEEPRQPQTEVGQTHHLHSFTNLQFLFFHDVFDLQREGGERGRKGGGGGRMNE